MIIRTRLFVVQIGRRWDLHNFPPGLLIIWRPSDEPRRWDDRGGHRFGFFLPVWPTGLFYRMRRRRGHEDLECYQFVESKSPIPHDHRKWPSISRAAADAAVRRAIEERPAMKIVGDWSWVGPRIDFVGEPLQLMRRIRLAKA